MTEKARFTSIHKKKEGLGPGTLVYVGDTECEETKIVTHRFDKDSYSLEPGPNPPSVGQTSWIQVSGLSDIAAISELGRQYQISNLNMEDALSTDQRPKLEIAGSYLSLTMRILEESDKGEEQVTFFLGKDWVISIVEHASEVFTPVVKRLSADDSRLRGYGADRLLHALADRLVDQYMVKADELDLQTEKLEELVVNEPDKASASSIHRHKREILHLRRISLPLKELFNYLYKNEVPFVSSSVQPFFRDTFDHASWLSEECDMLRETSQGLMEVYISSLDMKMNRIMKVLTIISTIFIPITFITGMYGMNFDYMPYLTQVSWGFFAVILFCTVLSVLMVLWFRRKKWW
jgi:magnesium transporter